MPVPGAVACALLLSLVAASHQLSITDFQVPDAVEVGENAELRCQYEPQAALYVKWWWTPSSSSRDDRRQIYQHIAGLKAEPVHHSRLEIKDNDTIVLLNVTPADSGAYECEVYNNIDEMRKKDELVVYTKGTGPELNISTISDGTENVEELLIECEAADVAPQPILVVTMSNGEEINITEVLTGPDSDGFYSVSANATRRKENVEPGDIRCEMFYLNQTIPHPEYVDVETYDPAGDDVSTTEVPGDAAPPEVTPESLQNPSDDGYRLAGSWALPMAAAILLQLQAL